MMKLVSIADKVGRELSRVVMSFPPIYNVKRAVLIGEPGCFVEGAREKLAVISPKPVNPWPAAHVAERNPNVELSIVVPVYNEEHYVGDCLRSICASKTKVRFEVVVIDDGSTDGSLAVCNEWATRDPRIRVVHQENRGFSGARNAGLDLAEGEVVMFVDSDDMVSETLVESLMGELKRTGAEVVSGGYTRMRKDGSLCRRMGATKGQRHGGPWSRVYRRASKRELRFPEGYWFEDTIITYMVLQQRKCSWVNNYGYFRRYHPAQIGATHRSSPKAVDGYWVVECVLDRMRELGMPLDQSAYDQTVRQFGPLLVQRTSAVLGEDEMRTLFSCCCDLIASTVEFEGLTNSLDSRWADVDYALRTRNYGLWRLACDCL